ncbi:reverse transcriptase domain-containing protein [Tanacetum coccineum]
MTLTNRCVDVFKQHFQVREILFLYCCAFSVSLLLRPLCCDDIHDVTPRVSALAGCDIDNAPRCYKCSGLGHYACDCPNSKTLAFVTDDTYQIYDTEAEPEVDESCDELVYPDRGEELVIQRVLNVAISKSVNDTSWLRNNIFRTKCTSKGKICDMIIDGGSCENVVSTYMVLSFDNNKSFCFDRVQSIQLFF